MTPKLAFYLIRRATTVIESCRSYVNFMGKYITAVTIPNLPRD